MGDFLKERVAAAVLEHDFVEDFPEGEVAVVGVGVVFVFGFEVGVGLDAVGDGEELDPLFFGGGAPALEPSLVAFSWFLLKGRVKKELPNSLRLCYFPFFFSSLIQKFRCKIGAVRPFNGTCIGVDRDLPE